MFEDGSIFNELFIERLNYLIYVVLLLIGLHGMIAKNNLIKKLIGMSIFQTAIILFYVSIGVKEGASIPIYLPEHDPHGSHATHVEGNESTEGTSHGPVVLEASLVKGYSNPLPHVLMLTAIVVGVATLGLALALCQRIYQGYGTIEEDELLAKIEQQENRSQTSGDSTKSNEEVVKKPTKAKAKTTKTKSKSTGTTLQKKTAPKAKAKSISTASKSPTVIPTKAKPKAKPKTTSRKPASSSKAKPAPKAKSTTQSKSAPTKAKAKSATRKPTSSSKAKPAPKAKSPSKPKTSSSAKKPASAKPKPRTPKK